MPAVPPPIDLLIACALRPEASAIAGRMAGAGRKSIGGFAGHRGLFAGRQTLLVRAGPGAAAARRGVACALGLAKPRLLIDFGAAGAVNPSLAPGDCLVSRTAIPYKPPAADRGASASPAGAFEPALHRGVALPGSLCDQLSRAPGVRLGAFGSADYSVAGVEARAAIREQYGLDAVDWETFAVLSLAEEQELPAFAFRVITDLAGPHAGKEFHALHRQLLAQAAERLARIVECLDWTALR
jgi:nucleoside phosphorylase